MLNFLNRNKKEEKFREIKEKNPLIDFLQSVTIAIVFSLILFTLITPSEVEGSSMEPNFYNGERVYTNRLPQWLGDTPFGKSLNLDYRRGDVIVFYKPGMVGSLIKRVIGLPGDKIKVENGHFFINDQELIEDYLIGDIYTKAGTFISEGEEKIVPLNSFFVAGDNRTVSNDSRYLGFILKEWMQGKIIFRLWPLDKIGLITEGQFELK